MSQDNVVQLFTEEDRLDQASLWVSKLDRGLSVKEEAAIVEWLSEHPKHKIYLFEMLEIWDRMDVLERLSGLFPIVNAQHHEADTPTRSAWPRVAKIAACFAVFVGMYFVVVEKNQSQAITASLAEIFAWPSQEKGVFETQVGEYSTVRLEDGSELTLNTDTHVKVQYSDQYRMFYLERGEVHIDVAHEPNRPLRVVTKESVVQAIGTAFNIQYLDSDKIELIVTDGVVKVEKLEAVNDVQVGVVLDASAEDLLFTQGQKVIIGAGINEVSEIDEVDIVDSLSWREGNIVFKGETLEEALVEIGRYSKTKFHVYDETIRSIRIAGMFRSGDVDGLLVALEQNFEVGYERLNESEIRLKKMP